MTIPKPHDPRVCMTPQELAARVAEVMDAPAADAQAEFSQLDRAHEVLRTALQEH